MARHIHGGFQLVNYPAIPPRVRAHDMCLSCAHGKRAAKTTGRSLTVKLTGEKSPLCNSQSPLAPTFAASAPCGGALARPPGGPCRCNLTRHC